MKILRKNQINIAAQIIKNGGIVAFPTETVYGLGADALNKEAIKKIYKAKGRATDNPLIVHISNKEQLKIITNELDEISKILMDAFWPGPLTLILPKKDIVPNETSANLKTIGVRMPNSSIATSLIEKAGPIAAPSANISGKPSPTMNSHVLDDLSEKIDALIEGPKCEIGIESTVFDPISKTLLRLGSITVAQIEDLIGKINIEISIKENEAPKSPGQKYKHYSPNAKLTIVKGNLSKFEENLIEVNAENLFATLRDLDKNGSRHAYIKYPDNAAVLDRVLKAAQYNILEV